MVDTTLVVSAIGIFVSGVVGPQLTAFATRRANRSQFDRDWASRQREELRALLDTAAIVLARGQTLLRQQRETQQKGQAIPPEVSDWTSQVFPLGQRLRLRLQEDHEVVQAYDRVREARIGSAEDDDEQAIRHYEEARATFLNTARRALAAPIEDSPPS